MRSGGYTVHQSLTAEAAAVLKLSLGLARRRGHAQVTPLHVAFTLLGGSTSSSAPPLSAFSAAATPSSCYGLLRRACVRSHPAATACSPAASHPLQYRALELSLNVALNRFPTTNVVVGGPLSSPSSSSSASSASSTSFSASLVQPNPTLSNALVAALKRAQANQRRGCIELQSQQSPPPTQQQQQQQQQPLLVLKVELDQLIISILDDPSVSRVMREAGFSSAAVKSILEEESAVLLGLGHHSSSSSSLAVAFTPEFLVEPYIDFPTHANGSSGAGGSWASWPALFFNQPGVGSSCKEEDVRAILEVMLRKQGRRTNPVVVGDSVSVAEASVAELMRHLEQGDVPHELRGAHVVRLHLSYVHVRLMSRVDVDARLTELRRSVHAIADSKAGGLIIYVGDMRWAVDEDDNALSGISPVEHMVAELARLLGELQAAARGSAWLVAAASYQTYMRCQQRRRTLPLEVTWALQPVLVPAGAGTDLALGPRGAPPAPAPSSMTEGNITRLAQIPLLDLATGEEEGVPILCAECASGFETEASLARAKAEGTTLALTYFPGWPQADEPQTSHKDVLMELRRKWSRSCQRLHLRGNQLNLPSGASPIPWWRAYPPNHQNKPEAEPKPSFDTPAGHATGKSNNQDVMATLTLLLPDSATTSEEVRRHRSEGLDAEPAVQGSNDAICSGDAVSIRPPSPWLDEQLPGDLKRKTGGDHLSSESKRWRDGGGLDLNICAAEEEEDGGDSEEKPAPSDLTNEGESSGEPGRHDSQDTSLDSH